MDGVPMHAVHVRHLSKTFRKQKALDDISLIIDRGEMVALIGASGSGKSTLIRHIAGLVCCDRAAGCGTVSVLGATVQDGGRMARDVRRIRRRVGVVFQQFNLVGRLSLLTNVVVGALGRMPGWRGALGLFAHADKRLAMEALARVGIAQHATQRASTLSGGQQQRAAIARALVQQAELILADEPIASLDPEAARKVMDNLAQINREDRITVVVALHQVQYAIAYCPRTVALRAGRVIYDGPSTALTPAFLRELYGTESDELLLPDPVITPARPRIEQRLRPALAGV
jgi:phosphonate transport system ATP-binding protein